MAECSQIPDCVYPQRRVDHAVHGSLEVDKDVVAEPLHDIQVQVRNQKGNAMLYAQIRSAHTVNTQNQRRDVPLASRCALRQPREVIATPLFFHRF